MSQQQQSAEQVCRQYLEEQKDLRGKYKLIFAMLAGSNAYNCQVETSDYDYFCVYQVNTCCLLSLKELQPRQTLSRTDDSNGAPDISCFEVGRFLESVQSGSPVILQSLFCRDHLTYQSEEWKQLKQHAHKFITTQTLKAYIGYAKAEIKQMKGNIKHDYNKYMYHAFRLVMEGETLTTGQSPQIWFESDTPEHTFLMNIRRNLLGSHDRNEHLRTLQERLESLEKKSNTPNLFQYDKLQPPTSQQSHEESSDHPYFILNNWLVSVRLSFLTSDT
jgi:predicted nucleotidyltransferase